MRAPIFAMSLFALGAVALGSGCPPPPSAEDAGPARGDAGPRNDAGASDDAGAPDDAGAGDDAGATDDAGARVDAGASDDAGPSSSADAGVQSVNLCLNGVLDNGELAVDCGSAACGPCPSPDPVTLAPPLDRSHPLALGVAVAFLYTGPAAPQRGVTPGAINALRAGVVTGRLIGNTGRPMNSVVVTVVGRPELGSAVGRYDGRFELVVNADAPFTLRFVRPGLLSSERTITPLAGDWLDVGDVALVALDPVVTTIDFAAPIEVARGSPQQDDEGTRQATLLFPAGTAAEMTLPNGTTLPLAHVSVRATEYTVGAFGRAAMPATLPPTTAFTYCAALTVDEALLAGAREVRFSKPVVVYLENFKAMPVGLAVPAGSYDPARSAWIPSDDGRVVSVLGADAGGRAVLDVAGGGLPADAAALAALGIDDAERVKVAELYAPGTSLWRVSVTHFTDWDFNYGEAPQDRPPPTRPPPKKKRVFPRKHCEVPGGSSVGCQAMTLAEDIPLYGTPFTLHHQSDAPDVTASADLDVSATGPTVPAGLKSVEVTLFMGGREQTQVLPPTPDQNITLHFDGHDTFDRLLAGSVPGRVQIAYIYQWGYGAPIPIGKSFARFPDLPAVGAHAGPGVIASLQTYDVTADLRLDRVDGSNGWTLSPLASYDPASRVLRTGTGEHRDASDSFHAVPTIAGDVAYGYGGDGEPALSAGFTNIRDMTVAPDGTIYLVDVGVNRVRKIDPGGIVRPVAGTGARNAEPVDGSLAVTSPIGRAGGLTLERDGSLLMTDIDFGKIRRIRPDGTFETVAGTGAVDVNFEQVESGDDGPATLAGIQYPYDLAQAPDGTLYVAEGNGVIRKIDPGGTITHVAGVASAFVATGDDGPASAATFDSLGDIALLADGSLLVSDRCAFRKISLDGTIRHVAGAGCGFDGDGGPASQAHLGVSNFAVSPAGVIMFENGANRIRRIGTDGIITTVAGDGNQLCNAPQAVLSSSETFCFLEGLTFGLDGELIISDNSRLRVLATRLPGLTGTGTEIVGPEGSNVYVFDPDARHIETRDLASGATLYRFAYDADGALATVADGQGNVTQVVHDAAGALVAVVAPGGERTALGEDAQGRLVTVTGPDGGQHVMTYSVDGLLDSFADPNGNLSRFTYDATGRLLKDESPNGGFMSLVRTALPDGQTVTFTTAEGRDRSYTQTTSTDETVATEAVSTDGTISTSVTTSDGVTTTTTPDGMVAVTLRGAGPRADTSPPVIKRGTITLPSGLTWVETRQRAVVTDPVDPSLFTLSEVAVVNGQRVTEVYDPTTLTWTTTSPMGRVQLAAYDAANRLTSLEGNGLAPVAFAYDGAGRMASITVGTGSSARVTSSTYDSAGRLLTITDGEGAVMSFTYDAAGRIASRTRADGEVEQYGYDLAGNRVSVTPPGRPAHTFAFDSVKLRTAYTPPAVAGVADATVRLERDRDRRRTAVRRPDGSSIQVAYAADHIASLTTPEGAVSFTYDATSGQVATVTSPAATVAFTYDGPLRTGETVSGLFSGAVASTFDATFQLASEAVDGVDVAFTRDRDGLLLSAGALSIVRDAESGAVASSALGVVNEASSYDGFGALSSRSADVGGSVVFAAQYVHDGVGRISSIRETSSGVTHDLVYAYDLAGRLVRVDRDAAPIAVSTFDGNGNRLTRDTGSGVVSATYDEQDRITSLGTVTFGHAVGGEVVRRTDTVSGAVTTYTWDAFGNLAAVVLPDGHRIDYVVDGLNRRIGKRLDGVLVGGLLWLDQTRVGAEVDAAGAVISRFVYADGATPAFMEKGGVTYRIITDHLGSPRVVVDAATGAVAERIDYDELGAVVSDSAPGFTPFGFAGGLSDNATGLVRFGAREYDPTTGRFMAKDPAGFEGGDTNLYAYAGGDPLNQADQSGLEVYVVRDGPHVQIIVPNGDGTGYRTLEFTPAADAKNLAIYLGLQVKGQVLLSEQSYGNPGRDHDRCAMLDTSEDQEAAMVRFAEAQKALPKITYELDDFNCVTFASKVLQAGGVDVKDRIWPFWKGLLDDVESRGACPCH